MRTDVAMIPGGATGLLQPPDVSWTKLFKAIYSECYEKWTQECGSSSQNLTHAGNPRPPSKLLMCTWIVTAWNALSPELIKRSFKICGLTNDLNGSDDHDIHALKTLKMIEVKMQRIRVSASEMDIENKVSSDDESCCEGSSSESK